MAYFHQRELGTGGHHADGVAGLDRAFKHADIDDDALVAVVDAVKDQRLQRGIRVAGGSGNIGNDTLQHLIHIQTGLGRNAGRVQTGQADHVLHLLCHLVRVGTGQIDLVQDGHQLQIMFQRHVGVCQRLGFHALGGVHHKDGTLTGSQTAADLIGKVHMARGIDKVELVGLAVLGGIVHGDGTGLDGDTALALDVHVVQDLVFHGALVHALGQLQNTVRQGGFTVVDVCDDAEVADIISCHSVPPKKLRSYDRAACGAGHAFRIQSSTSTIFPCSR